MKTDLPTLAWGHTILHATGLLLYRPFAYNSSTSHHLAFGTAPDITHLRTFGCKVLVPILAPNAQKWGPRDEKGSKLDSIPLP